MHIKYYVKGEKILSKEWLIHLELFKVNAPHLNQSKMMFSESNITQIFKPWDIEYEDKSGSQGKEQSRHLNRE